MPRPTKLRVVEYPSLVASRDYPARVAEVRVERKKLRVQLEHISERQQGRRHSLCLSLPVRPFGLTADFFRACSVQVNVGRTLDPRACLQRIANVRFERSPDGEWAIVSIKPLQKEHKNEPGT